MKNFILIIFASIQILILTGCNINNSIENQEGSPLYSSMSAEKQITYPDSQTRRDITAEFNDELVSIIGMNYLDVEKKFGGVKETMWWDGQFFMHEYLDAWLGYDNLEDVDNNFNTTDNSMVNVIMCRASMVINREEFSEKDFDNSLIEYNFMSEMNIIIFKYKDVIITIDISEDGTIDEKSLLRILHPSIALPKQNNF